MIGERVDSKSFEEISSRIQLHLRPVWSSPVNDKCEEYFICAAKDHRLTRERRCMVV